jgi:hypothetical protein
MTHRAPPISLREASEAFGEFLRNNNYPEELLWVGEADVLWDRRQLWLRPAKGTSDIACERYADGIKRRLGMALHAFSSIEGITITTIFVPEDEDVAQRFLILPNGLKFSAATNRLPARPVSSSLKWLLLSARYRVSSRLFRADYLTYT